MTLAIPLIRLIRLALPIRGPAVILVADLGTVLAAVLAAVPAAVPAMDLVAALVVAVVPVTVRMMKAKSRKGQPPPPVTVKGLHPVTATFFCAPSLISPGATGARCLLSRPPPT